MPSLILWEYYWPGFMCVEWLQIQVYGTILINLLLTEVDDFVIWATLGIILGGRLGYVLFYNPLYYLTNPIEIPQIWKGGMSFHGGSAGIVVAIIWFAKRRGLSFWQFFDMLGAAAPIGLFFGRIANFINSELWGRTTDVPWGFIVGDSRLDTLINQGSLNARHPSQLYEAFLEGLVLFLILLLVNLLQKETSTTGICRKRLYCRIWNF